MTDIDPVSGLPWGKFDPDFITRDRYAHHKAAVTDTEVMAGILNTPGIAAANAKPLEPGELYEAVMKAIEYIRNEPYGR